MVDIFRETPRAIQRARSSGPEINRVKLNHISGVLAQESVLTEGAVHVAWGAISLFNVESAGTGH